MFTKKKLYNSKEILEEISNVLKLEKNNDGDVVSLYDVSILLRKVNKNYKDLIKKFEYSCEYILKSEFYDPSIYISDFKNNQLKIGFICCIGKDYKFLIFKKKDGELYVVESESMYTDKILYLIGSELSKLYDELLIYNGFINQYNFKIKPVNSNFLIDISQYGVNVVSEEFELSCHSYTNNYDCKCNSTMVLNELKGNEDEIFKRIFVKIEDCPEWSRETLYQLRHEQLVESTKENIKNKILKLFKK